MQETEDVRMHVVVVTGMSGSGKSVVMDVLEDIGYYCIDNLPPQLMGKFVDICRESENHLQKLAIAADLRSGDMFTDAYRTHNASSGRRIIAGARGICRKNLI